MSYPSSIDIMYYTQKYNISDRLTKKDIATHYYKIGRKMGYFPNIMAEKYYCQLKNFDPVFYAKKYDSQLQNLNPLSHWKRHGYKNNNYTCECEETGRHLPDCKCLIKENCSDTNECYENKCNIMIANKNNESDNDIPSITSDNNEQMNYRKREIVITNDTMNKTTNKLMNKRPIRKKNMLVQHEVYDFIKADISFVPKKNNDNALTFASYMCDSRS